MLGLQLVFSANVLVAGWVGLTSLLAPKAAIGVVFTNAYGESEVIRLVGALWVAIALLSVAGIWRPYAFAPVLLLQLLYKAGWLLLVALPALQSGSPFPKAMALFFLVWVLVLPFVIPWKHWLTAQATI